MRRFARRAQRTALQKDFAGNVQHSERSGILLAAAGFSSLSVGDAIVKTMAGEWSPLAVAALRFTIGAIALSLLLLRSEGPGAFRPRRPLLQVARGACLAGATLCFFSAVFVMQLAEAMALAFVSPVFVALLSGPLLKEKVRPAVWIASPIALVGVMLVLRPNFAELGIMAGLPLLSAFFFGLMVICNRAAAGDGSALSMQVFIACLATPFLIAAAVIGHVSGAPGLQVVPGDTLMLMTRELKANRRRFITDIQGIVEGKLVFEAQISGMVF